jgi:hypothetical protein
VSAATPVAVGDGVRTDATGYAEIAYLDGSRTRLDVSTEFEVIESVDDAGAVSTRTRMGVGRTWHRVGPVGTAGGGLSVETSQATAAVRGAGLSASCLTAESCHYVVYEGTAEVTLADGTVISLVAPAALDVTNGVAMDPMPLPWDTAFADPWLVDNATRDATAGFADAATMFSAHGPAFGSMAGPFSGTRTITDLTCTSYCDEAASEADIGTVTPLEPDFRTDCSSGACAMVGQAGVPYSFDGTSYRAQIPTVWEEGMGTCSYRPADGSAETVTGTLNEVTDATMTPTAAEVRNGIYTVTALDYAAVVTLTTDGHCAIATDVASLEEYMALPPYEGYTVTWAGSATR